MNQATESKTEAVIDRAVTDAASIGKVWAKYGLTVGRAALETSAHTLEKAAAFLGDLSAQFAEKSEKPVVESDETHAGDA